MRLSRQSVITALCALGLGPAASATVIASYGFDGSSFGSSAAVTGAPASDLTNGAGVPLTLNGSQGLPAPSLEFSFGTVGANLSQSVAEDDYYSFTITPVSAEVTYNTFDFDFFKTANAGANVQAVLFSSVDGFTVGDELGVGQLSGSGDSGSFQFRSISLASLPADLTTPVEFRLYIHDSGASNQNNVFRLDNLSLDATVTIIPEPTSGLLVLLGLPLLAMRRR